MGELMGQHHRELLVVLTVVFVGESCSIISGGILIIHRPWGASGWKPVDTKTVRGSIAWTNALGTGES
jgi:hypothetical protein